jgi:hypothetical protein
MCGTKLLGVNLSDLTHVRVCDAQDLASWNFPEPDFGGICKDFTCLMHR